MRIGVNTTGMREIAGGVSEYTRGLLDGLRRIAPEDDVQEFTFRRRFSRDRRLLRAVDTVQYQCLWLHRSLPRQIRERGIELFHSPGTHIPLRCPVPLVVTFHDLYTIRNRAAFRRWHQTSSRVFARQSLERADRIIAVSDFTRREILDMYGPSYDARMTVVHEAAHARYRPMPAEACRAVVEKFRLANPYVLCVGTIEPRKNLEAAFRAFARIQDRVPQDLVIVGGKGWKQDRLGTLVAALRLQDRVRFLGYVDEDDLPALYAQADLFAYPSVYEGFGIPILEAMSCGCPVLTSDAASMPEVAGEAAVLADPTHIDDIAEKLEGVLLDPSRRAALSAAGITRATAFSWDRCARETRVVYQSLV